MHRPAAVFVAVFAGLLAGLVVAHAPATPALSQPMMTQPMMSSSSMMSSMKNCPAMQTMMMHATAPADRAMMQAMMMMHQSMSKMRFTGDADRDFLTMMIPHHQSAIDMANVELRYGKDPHILALARRIIAAQTAEIREMRGWLSRPR